MINTIIISSIFLSLLSVYFVGRFFSKKSIVDKINDRSSHNTVAYRIGGISIFTSVFLLSVFYYVKGVELYDYSLLIPLAILLFVGFYDDLYEVDFKLKFIFQIIAAKIIIDSGLIIDNMHGIIGVYELNRIVAQVLTIFIIVAIINSINFIDGIDGLAILIVAKFIILVELFANSDLGVTYLSLIVLFSTLPLLYFNFKKKEKIFLGDAGSHFLGGVVSILVLYVLSQDYLIKPQFDINKILFILSILSYPIFDIIRVSSIRVLNGKSPFVADKNHIHHIILKKLGNHLYTSLMILILSFVFTILMQLIF
tara:strand:+ start:6475 stop:7407 length:933 start_codon:yes stop_codon:yes gene_type:complete